ncbi:unnamed protein product, partial [marine sediment metagenome]
NLTQFDLAKRANVSQSLIAKIESDRIDPTYTKVQQIFDALNMMGKKQEIKASEIMHDKIISVSPEENISEAIKKMKKFNISQLPVIEDNKSIGLVSEAIILDAMLNKKAKKAKEIMEDSPPVVSKNTGVNAVSSLLQSSPMILVSDNGKLKGVITKSDLLGKVYK